MNCFRVIISSLVLLCLTAICPAQAEDGVADRTLIAGNTLPACYSPAINQAIDSFEGTLVRGNAQTETGNISQGDRVKDGVEVSTDRSSWCELSGTDGTIVRFWHGSKARVSWKKGFIHVDSGEVMVRIPRGATRPYILSVDEGSVTVKSGTVRVSKTRYGTRITSLESGDLLRG